MIRKNKIWFVVGLIIVINLFSVAVISADSVSTSGTVQGGVNFTIGTLLDFGTITVGNSDVSGLDSYIQAGASSGFKVQDTLNVIGGGWNVKGVMPSEFVRGTFDSIAVANITAKGNIIGTNTVEDTGDPSAVASTSAGLTGFTSQTFVQAGTTTLSSAITLVAADTTTARFGSYNTFQPYLLNVPAFTTPGTYTGTYTLTLTLI